MLIFHSHRHKLLSCRHIRQNPKGFCTNIAQRMNIRKKRCDKEIMLKSHFNWEYIIPLLPHTSEELAQETCFCLLVFKISYVCYLSAIPSFTWQTCRMKADLGFGTSWAWRSAAEIHPPLPRLRTRMLAPKVGQAPRPGGYFNQGLRPRAFRNFVYAILIVPHCWTRIF